MKTCSKCYEELPLSSFSGNVRNSDGLMAFCKLCDKSRKAATRQRDPIRAYSMDRAAYVRHRIKRLEQKRLYYKKNKASFFERNSKRRAIKRGALAKQDYSRTQIFRDYNNLCAYCLSKATCLDHIVPLSAGGSDSYDNLVPACRGCNNRKYNKSLLQFLLTRL